MRAEIVMIGSELLLGQNTDTNARFLGETLARHGIPLYRKTTVGDNLERLGAVLEEALGRADAVLTSGGLGPTEDDLTREAVAAVLGRPLELRQDLLDALTERFARMRRPLGENNKKQAWTPAGAEPIPNAIGTASGFIAEDPRGVIIAMPGVPRELYRMTEDHVIPWLRQRFALGEVLRSRVLKVSGVGESRVDDWIGDLIRTQQNPTVGVLASPEAVRIRITARAANEEEAAAAIAGVEATLRERLQDLVMGVEEDTLEGVVDGLLGQLGWTLALAEGPTGGLLAQRFTACGSKALVGGAVYPRAHAAPTPEAAAAALAEEARERWSADCGLATVHDPATGVNHGCFVTPEETVHWETGAPPDSGLLQRRAAAASLERVRRVLLTALGARNGRAPRFGDGF